MGSILHNRRVLDLCFLCAPECLGSLASMAEVCAGHSAHVTSLHTGFFPRAGSVEFSLFIAGIAQLLLGAATWAVIRPGMAIAQDTGEFTECGFEAIACAVKNAERDQRHCVADVYPPCGQFLDSDGDTTSSESD